jgi:hypothetical protein
MLCPFDRLDHSNYTWRRVQVMKLHITQFSPTSRHFITLRSKLTKYTCYQNWNLNSARVDPAMPTQAHVLPLSLPPGDQLQLVLTAMSAVMLEAVQWHPKKPLAVYLMTSEIQTALVITEGMMVNERIGKDLEGIGHGRIWGIFLGGPSEVKKSVSQERPAPDWGLNREFSE